MSRRARELEKQVAELLRRVEQIDSDVARLTRENAELREENSRLRKRLERFERRKPKDDAQDGDGPQDGDNSTGAAGEAAPPADPSAPAAGSEAGKRKRGGQPGHAPRVRDLLPADQVDRVLDHKPSNCDACGRQLKGDDPSPLRHQVTELAKKLTTVTEHRFHALVCSCGERTCAERPADVPAGAFGPGLLALVGLLSGAYRLSKRKAQELLADVFRVGMSLGVVSESEQTVSEALAVPVEAARDFARAQDVANVDDTSWPERNKKSFLWAFVTQFVTYFMILPRRTTEAAQEVLGEFDGTLCSDRLASFDFWADEDRQVCWAHLDRKFDEWLYHDREEVRQLGRSLLVETRTLFRLWGRVDDGPNARDGPLSRPQFKTLMRPLRPRVRALLEQGASYDIEKVSGTCRHLLEHEDSLWTFVDREGVEPTNNAAERALRHGVLWRNGSFGTQSARGSLFVERVLTAEATLRKQDRNVVQFVTQAVHAYLSGRRPPSLLPSRKLLATALAPAYQATG